MKELETLARVLRVCRGGPGCVGVWVWVWVWVCHCVGGWMGAFVWVWVWVLVYVLSIRLETEKKN